MFFPVIWIVTGLSRLILKPFGVRAATWRRRLTKDQLRLLLTSEGERSGAVDEQETKLISGIFEFALTTVEVEIEEEEREIDAEGDIDAAEGVTNKAIRLY